MPKLYRCRRTVRDEEAGLLFRWRVPRGSLGRTLVAVMLATALFAAGAVLFQGGGRTVRNAARESMRVVVLPPESEAGKRWLDWALLNSPFPDRWEVRVDEILQQHLDLFNAELAERAKYEPLLRPMTVAEREPTLPGLFDPAAPRLPHLEIPSNALPAVEPPTAPDPVIEVQTSADGEIAKRWGQASWPLALLLAPGGAAGDAGPGGDAARAAVDGRELLGLRRRFLVMVDAAGEVVFCQLIDEVASDLDRMLATRLREHRLAPASAPGEMALAAGFVDVVVRQGAVAAEAVP